jgi:hypothetical protein
LIHITEGAKFSVSELNHRFRGDDDWDVVLEDALVFSVFLERNAAQLVCEADMKPKAVVVVCAILKYFIGQTIAEPAEVQLLGRIGRRELKAACQLRSNGFLLCPNENVLATLLVS